MKKKELPAAFAEVWRKMMQKECHEHGVWSSSFFRILNDEKGDVCARFELATVWAANMLHGSAMFPNYVLSLASRISPEMNLAMDTIRHGLVENAWDELGSLGHTKRSHFWLVVRLNQLLGLTEAELQQVKPLDGTLQYVSTHYNECRHGDMRRAMGLLCVIEESTAHEFVMIRDAMVATVEAATGMKQQEFIDREGAEYFNANIEDDERHKLAMPSLVASWLACDGVDMEDAAKIENGLLPFRSGIRWGIALRETFFNAIYHFVQSGGTFRSLVRQ